MNSSQRRIRNIDWNNNVEGNLVDLRLEGGRFRPIEMSLTPQMINKTRSALRDFFATHDTVDKIAPTNKRSLDSDISEILRTSSSDSESGETVMKRARSSEASETCLSIV
jgi:hypothetical protein